MPFPDSDRSRAWPRTVPAGWVVAVAALLFQLVTSGGYGYFRDELYYLANGAHLDWGYVEHPPMVGMIAAVVQNTLGTSLVAIRLWPAIAGALTVWLAAAIAAEMGGGRFAQTLAAVATFLAPSYVGLFSVFTMNAFDVLAWAVEWWLVAHILRTGRDRLWLVFGAVAGAGLENKISLLFLGTGLAIGLVLSGRWREIRSQWLWLGALIAGLLFLPYLLWQHAHGWPLLEFMAHAREQKNVAFSPVAFLREQILLMNPLGLPVWLFGLVFLLGTRAGRSYRVLGWAYVGILVTMLVAGDAKPYYLAPAYTALFAAGGVAIESWTRNNRGTRFFAPVARAAVTGLVVVGGAITVPYAKPVLSEDAFVRYANALGSHPAAEERHRMGRLPQFFADMHGWPELADSVARVFKTLSPEEQQRACIFAQNYGQAGAISLFGKQHGMPDAISGHNSYYFWGPQGCTGDVVIVLDDDRAVLERLFARVDFGAIHTCVDCMPYESGYSIWIARGLREPMTSLWPRVRRFI